MSKHSETKDHVITKSEESLVPLDPGGIIGGIIGHTTPTVDIKDKVTGQTGHGTGKDAEEKAWTDLRSKNEAAKR